MALSCPTAAASPHQRSQEQINQEWDEVAGEWDDIAATHSKLLFRYLRRQLTQWGIPLPLGNHRDNGSTSTAAAPAIGETSASDMVVMDFGCGTGLFTEYLQPRVRTVVAIDPSVQMMELLLDKIRDREWENVRAFSVALAHLNEADSTTQEVLRDLEGKVDCIVANSVLSLLPHQDVERTLQELGRFLKPTTGWLIHTDWADANVPYCSNNTVVMTEAYAGSLYQMAGLEPVRTEVVDLMETSTQQKNTPPLSCPQPSTRVIVTIVPPGKRKFLLV